MFVYRSAYSSAMQGMCEMMMMRSKTAQTTGQTFRVQHSTRQEIKLTYNKQCMVLHVHTCVHGNRNDPGSAKQKLHLAS